MMESERSRSEFFANVSHELRTPLTLILAPLETLLTGESGRLNDDQRRVLETVHRNATHLLQMVNGLLDFAKLDAGKATPRPQPTDVIQLVRSLLADFEPYLNQKGLKQQLDLGSGGIIVDLDRYLFERIFYNLVSNAVKFTPEGGTITIQLRHREGRLRLLVADTGIGIAEVNLPHLFQRFEQFEGASTRRFQGTGLGLALVKEFTELQGGTVSVASTLGQGSRFTVELPALPCAAQGVRDLPARRRLPQKYGSKPGVPVAAGVTAAPTARVLIAEDNEELADYIAGLLAPVCQTRIATDGQEALDSVQIWEPDLVLADIMMPKKTGLALCQDIKANPLTADVPVILLTAQTSREALIKGWEAGADDYLFKPFHPQEVVARIQSLLRAQSWRREIEDKLRQSERLAAVGQMVAGLAHESRNALQRGQACLDLLRLRLKDHPEAIDLVEDVQRSQDQLHHLHEEVRNYAGPIRVKRQSTDLAELLRRTWIAQTGLRVGRDTQLDQHAESKNLFLKVDPVAIGQVFRNILENALSACGDPAVIRVAWSDVEAAGTASLRISFQDNGPGLTPEARLRIFEPFFTTKTQGTGLGMAIAQRIVEAHGGQLAVGTEAAGAEIVITLPREAS